MKLETTICGIEIIHMISKGRLKKILHKNLFWQAADDLYDIIVLSSNPEYNMCTPVVDGMEVI